MKPYQKFAAAAILLLGMAALAGCGNDDIAGTSTETVTGKTVGRIFLAEGQPAAGARIRVLPVSYKPLSDSNPAVSFRTITDDSGRYYLDSLPNDEYNIFSSLDGGAAYQDSVFLSGRARTLPSDTLSEPGSLSGYVSLQPGDPLLTVKIQLLGTQNFTNVNARGFFTLPDLAAGTYRAAISTTLPEYTTSYAFVEVRSGRHDTLPDTLGPVYTGIPQVSGLRAEFDTLAQAVSLSWPAVDYPELANYLVFRDLKGSLVLSDSPIASVQDTHYIDRLPFYAFPGEEGSESVTQWEYRVQIRDKFGEPGRSYGSLSVNAPSAAFATSYLESHVANAIPSGDGQWEPKQWQASVGDTVFLILHAANRTRLQKMVRWFPESGSTPIRTTLTATRDLRDTLMFICPNQPRSLVFRAEVADEAGSEWAHHVRLDIVQDLPTVTMPERITGELGSTIGVHGAITNRFGRIVKMEWKFGDQPWSAPTLSNDTTMVIPETGLLDHAVILKVTDDDGFSAADTVLVSASPWRQGAALPVAATSIVTVTLGKVIYAIGGHKISPSASLENVSAFDTETGIWSIKSPMPGPRSSHCAAALDGRIYVLAGHNNGSHYTEGLVYEPATDQWASLPPIPNARAEADAFAYNGKIYVMGGYDIDGNGNRKATNRIDVFDPVAAAWSSFITLPAVWGALKTAIIGDKVYAFAVGAEQKGQFASYEIASDTWTLLGNIPNETMFNEDRPFDYSVVAYGEKILLVGGFYHQPVVWAPSGRFYSAKTYEYIPANKDWNGLGSLPRTVSGPGLAVVGKRFYSIGGTVSLSTYFPTRVWEDFDEVYWRTLP